MALPEKNSFLKEVLCETLTEDHVAVINQLDEAQYDEDIAEDLGIKATIVRTLLNDLHQCNLVEYQRSKNKKTGWYTYMWVRRDEKIQEYIENYLKQKLAELNMTLDNETNGVSFMCNCNKVPYEDAMEQGFICAQCQTTFTEYNNSEEVDDIVSEITRLNSLLEKTIR